MPFCMECGTKLPDEAKYCFMCGKPLPGVAPSKHITIEKPQKGAVRVQRGYSFESEYFDCTVSVDSGQPKKLTASGQVILEAEAGTHTIYVKTFGKPSGSFTVYFPSGGIEEFSFMLDGKGMAVPASTCPRCGGKLEIQSVGKANSHISIHTPLPLTYTKSNSKAVSIAVCQRCGYQMTLGQTRI